MALTRRYDVEDAPITSKRPTPTAGPAPLASELGRQPGLPIDAGDRSLDVRDDRLDLDDEDDPGSRVIREDVVRTSFTPDGERRFDLRRPSVTRQEHHDLIHEAGMRLVQQPIQRLALPSDPDVKRRVQRLGRACQQPERDRPDPAVLDPRDRRVRHADARAEVDLAPAASKSERTDRMAEPNRVHAGIVGLPAYPSRIRRVCPIRSGGRTSRRASVR